MLDRLGTMLRFLIALGAAYIPVMLVASAGGTGADRSQPRPSASVASDLYSSLASAPIWSLWRGETWQHRVFPGWTGIIAVDRGAYTEYRICSVDAFCLTDRTIEQADFEMLPE